MVQLTHLDLVCISCRLPGLRERSKHAVHDDNLEKCNCINSPFNGPFSFLVTLKL